MIRVQHINSDSVEWANVLARCVHDVYHTPAWARTMTYCDGGEGSAIHVTDGTHDFICPMVRRKIDSDCWDAISPYGYGGPVISNAAPIQFVESAYQAATEFFRRAGCVSWFIRLHPIINASWASSAGLLVQHGQTLSIDLTHLNIQRWRENHRRDIRNAEMAGVKVRHDAGFSSLRVVTELYTKTMSRLNASDYYFFEKRYFAKLVAELDNQLLLFVAEEEGEIIGASFFTVCMASRLMQYHLSAAAPQCRHRQPAKMILKAACEWAAVHQLHRLHLGGGVGAVDDSLFRFKLGFADTTHRFMSQRIIVNEERYRYYSQLEARSFIDCSGFFPQYRQLTSRTTVVEPSNNILCGDSKSGEEFLTSLESRTIPPLNNRP